MFQFVEICNISCSKLFRNNFVFLSFSHFRFSDNLYLEFSLARFQLRKKRDFTLEQLWGLIFASSLSCCCCFNESRLLKNHTGRKWKCMIYTFFLPSFPVIFLYSFTLILFFSSHLFSNIFALFLFFYTARNHWLLLPPHLP